MFIWGIVDACVFKYYVGSYYDGRYIYGVMKLSSGFLSWLIWMAIGAVVSAIAYAVTKLSLSYKILHLLYLQCLLGEKLEEESAFVMPEKKPFTLFPDESPEKPAPNSEEPISQNSPEEEKGKEQGE